MNATQPTAYEAALEELAHSRGLADLEELRDRLRTAGHERTARRLVEGPCAWYGQHFDHVLNMTEEKARLSMAFAQTFLRIRR